MNDTASDAPRDPLVGTRLGSYEIVDILGKGGYSVVYRAKQVPLNREVALKVLTTKETGIIEEQVEAFLNEARIAAKLDHPCLLNVYDVIEAEGQHGLAMELVEGGDLARRIKRDGPVPWREATPIIRDVARALEFAHSHGHTHRDVKPANVLLTLDGGARLADLGLTDSTAHAGTAAFMAPEQILRRKTGRRTDIYALGCTAFAMLTGRAPFASDSSKKMLKAHLHEKPTFVSDHDIDVPEALDDLIDAMLEKQPRDRPASARDVIDALDAIEAQADPPESAAPKLRARSRIKRSRATRGPGTESMIVLLVIVLFILAGAVYIWRQLQG